MAYLQQNLKDNLKSCSRCGGCKSVCPVFAVSGQEVDVARGKVQVIKALEKEVITLSEDTPLIIQQCLLCRACTTNCPSGVETSELIKATRVSIADNKGVSLTKRSILTGLLQGQKVPSAAKALFNFVLINKLPLTKGLPTLETESIQKMLRKLVRELNAEEKNACLIFKPSVSNYKLALFYGCADAQFSHKRIKELIKILLLNAIEVHIPLQKCCGLPFAAAGLNKKKEELSIFNLKSFTLDVDGIITACSSCASELKEQGFKSRIYDAVEFLSEYTIKPPKGFTKEVKYTYHHPCHAIRYQGLENNFKNIFANVNGMTYTHMQGADQCCGGGGTFSFEQVELAEKIANKKVANIVSAQAEVVITSCPGCMMQISAALEKANQPIPVKHFISVLYDAYQNK